MEDSIDRLRHRDLLLVCVMALLIFGVVMVQSAMMSVGSEAGWMWTARGMRHAMYAMAALGVFLIVGNLDYRWLVRGGVSAPQAGPLNGDAGRRFIFSQPVMWVLGIAIFLSIIVLIPGIGEKVNGARRWLRLGVADLQVQPSELAKWGLVIFLAWWLTSRPVDLSRLRGFVLTLVPIGVICLLTVIYDFGTAALIGSVAMAMLLVGRVKLWHLGIVIPPALAVAYWFVASTEYRWRRMTAFLDPWASPQGEGYHMIQSLLSFSTGGLWGRGLGNGVQKLGYLPEDTTDFIFAVICEELGIFGAGLTVGLYLAVIYLAWQAVRVARDEFGRMLAFGIAAMLGLQATINIAVATVSVPTKGLSLPLISAGGSGLIITCGALGLLYSVLRMGELAGEEAGEVENAGGGGVVESTAGLTYVNDQG